MSDFKSDYIDAVASSNSYLPTGVIIQLAGPYSQIQTPNKELWIEKGLIPCDGSSYLISAYQDLYNVITTLYNTSDGQSAPAAGSFRVPRLHTNKLSLGMPNTSIAGTVTNSTIHTHTAAEPTWSAVASTHDHTHNVVANTSLTAAMNAHNHAIAADFTFNSTAPNNVSNASDGTQSQTLGNHSHTVTANSSNITTVSVNSANHEHNINTANTGVQVNPNTGAALSSSHGHNVSNNAQTVVSAELDNNPYPVPYANVLYFIKA
jgi:microcystin-dependent protein